MPALHAHLPVAAERGLTLICDNARALGLTVTRSPLGAEVQAGPGNLRARPETGGLRLEIDAADSDGLERIRSTLDRMILAAGLMVQPWHIAAAPKSRLLLTRFAGATRISLSYVRARLEGDFSAFAAGGLHFRLLLGQQGAAMPQPAADGGIDWPGGIENWHRPPYTVRRLDAAAGWLEFDIFLHEGGRVTDWVLQARPGEIVGLTGPGGRGVRQAGWMGMVGDETAMPVILRALEAAPASARGQAMILLPDITDAQEVALPAGLQLTWVPRREGRSLLDLFRSLQPPAEDRFLFLAGERQEAEAARIHAGKLGLATTDFHAASYWTAGRIAPSGPRQAGGNG